MPGPEGEHQVVACGFGAGFGRGFGVFGGQGAGGEVPGAEQVFPRGFAAAEREDGACDRGEGVREPGARRVAERFEDFAVRGIVARGVDA